MMTQAQIVDVMENCAQLPYLSPSDQALIDLVGSWDTFDVNSFAEELAKHDDLLPLVRQQAYRFLPHADTSSLRDALVILGAKSLRNILLYSIIRRFFSREDTCRGAGCVFDLKDHWLYVLGVSAATELLADRVGRSDGFRLFSYALLLDIGILAMGRYLPEVLDEIYRQCVAGVPPVVAEKIAMGGLTHADIGGWLCQRWELPDDVVQLVKHHHSCICATCPCEELWILSIADEIATEYHYALLGINPVAHRIDERILRPLGLTREDVEEIGGLLPERVESIREVTLAWTEEAVLPNA